jgi:hypothetical protein
MKRSIVALAILGLEATLPACDRDKDDDQASPAEEEVEAGVAGGVAQTSGQAPGATADQVRSRIQVIENALKELEEVLGEEEAGLRLTEDQSLVDILRSHVMVDAGREVDDGTTLVYRLLPEVVCKEDDGSIGEDCAKLLASLEPRFRFTMQAGDAVAIELLFGAERATAIAFAGNVGEMRLEAHAAGVQRGLDAIAAAQGEKAPTGPTPWSGTLAVSATRTGERAFTFEASAAQGLELSLQPEGGNVGLSLAPTKKIASVLLDPDARHAQVEASIKGFEIFAPVSATGMEDGPLVDKELRIVGSGLNGVLDMHPGEGTVSLTGFDLGAKGWDVAVDGAQVAHVEITAPSIEATGLGEQPSFTVASGFQLVTRYDLTSLELDDAKPSMLQDEISITVAGNKPMILSPASADGQEAIAGVETGSMTLGSTHGGSLTVSEGECLVPTGAEDMASWLENFRVAACD